MLKYTPSGLLDQAVNISYSGLLFHATPIIEDIILSKAENFKFSYFEGSDIGQEIWAMSLKLLAKYDASKCNPNISFLENLKHFLRRSINNRLKNLKRDKYFKSPKKDPSKVQSRLNIVNAISLYEEGCSINNDPLDNLMAKELSDQIKSFLTEDMKKDLDLLLNGDLDDENRIQKLKKKIKAILSKYHE